MEQNLSDVTVNSIKAELDYRINRKHLIFTTKDFPALTNAAVILFNRLSSKVCFNSNITIKSTDPEISTQFGITLAEVIEKWFPDSVVTGTEKDLQNWDSLPTMFKNHPIMVVRDYVADDPDSLYRALSRIRVNEWAPSIILCTTYAEAARLEKHPDDDYRLYNYLCGYKVDCPDIDKHNVAQLTLDRLLQEGYTASDDFKKKLGVYVDTIYDGAELTKEAFIEDLVSRIYQAHYKKFLPEKELVISDVPESVKADSRWLSGKAYDFSELNFTKKKCGAAEQGNAGIFLVLSKYNPRSRLAEYISEDNVSYPGIQTNDAPIQYLIDKIHESGYRLRKVVCVTTPEVETTDENGVNTLARFVELVRSYSLTAWDDPDVTVDNVSYSDESDEEKRYSEFYKNLNDKVNDVQAFFVDYTGGLRDTSFLMVGAIRFLEYKGIKCEKVIYSDFFAKPKKQIRSLDKVYSVFQMINGMSEFVSSGTTRQLDDLFNKTGAVSRESETEIENPLVNAIRYFSNAVNLGDMEHLDYYIDKLNEELSRETEKNDLKNAMIGSMKDVISRKLFGSPDGVSLINANGDKDYYSLIKWCIDNKMFQQAATLYIEKVPVIYFRDKIISGLIEPGTESGPGSSPEATAFFTKLSFWALTDPKKENFEAALNAFIDTHTIDKASWDKNDYLKNLETALAGYPEAYDRLKRLIDYTYPDYDKAAVEPECIYGKECVNFKSIQKFMEVLPKKRAIIDYLLYDNAEAYSASNGNDKVRNLFCINKLFDNEIDCAKTNDDRALGILMAFYLAIKLLRNKMSHASENPNEEDTAAINGLEKFFSEKAGMFNPDIKGIRISLQEKDIDTLLRLAASYSEKATHFMKSSALS